MKRSLCLLLLASAALASAGHVPQEWKDRYAYEKKVIVGKDLEAFKAMYAEDYVWTQPDGKKKNKKETFEEVGPMFQADKIEMHETLKSVTKRGDIVDVSFDATLKLTFKGKPTMAYHEIGIDSWKKVKGKWLIVGTVDKVSEEIKAK
ncbi:MAG: nuclear transport factor 2 family protein [Armatimonadetes bacterium]|nr:nuclear transport factor 2 family protein [Armatimonadota bacterium]